jgi:hypothetical protein
MIVFCSKRLRIGFQYCIIGVAIGVYTQTLRGLTMVLRASAYYPLHLKSISPINTAFYLPYNRHLFVVGGTSYPPVYSG